MRDPQVSTFEQLPVDLARTVSLLRLAGCKVHLSEGINPILYIDYWTPLGAQRAAGVVLDSTAITANLVEIAASQLVETLDASGLREAVVFHGDIDSAITSTAVHERVRFQHIEELARNLALSRGYAQICERELRDRIASNLLLPIPACVSVNGIEHAEYEDALDALKDFAVSGNEMFCCLVGSFGSGKSVLLRRLAAELIVTPVGNQAAVFPLVVDLAGCGARGLAEAIATRVTEVFGAHGESDLGDLVAAFAGSLDLLFLLDSLDEQAELNPGAISALIDSVVALPHGRRRVVLAFRPELFEGSLDQKAMLFDRVKHHGLQYRVIETLPLTQRAVAAALAHLSVNTEVRALSEELARRPVWLRAVASLPVTNGGGQQLTKIELIQHCINTWAERENRTRRPALLTNRQREMLMMLLTFCLHSGYGIHIERPDEVHRAELVRFVRKLLPRLQEVDPEMQHYLRWLQLPPDLTAESLAVANLLVINSDGFLRFGESIFLHYYLALGVAAVLREEKHSFLAEQPFLDMFDITSPVELLGIAEFPGEPFRSMLDELLAMKGSSDLAQRLRAVVLQLRPPCIKYAIPSWERLLVGYRPGMLEEERSYELLVPEHWPRFGSWFTMLNVVRFLAGQDMTIESENFSLQDFAYSDLRGITFRGCSFVGSDLAFSRLQRTRFVDCDLSYALLPGGSEDTDFEIQGGQSELSIWWDSAAANPDAHPILRSLRRENEVWVIDGGAIGCGENQGYPVRVSAFLADRTPVTNAEFASFLEAYPDYDCEGHGVGIENQYYLAFLREAQARGMGHLPLVYVTLVAAVAYSLWAGKRLPSTR